MYLSRHSTSQGSRWALDGQYLPARFDLGLLLEVTADEAVHLIQTLTKGGTLLEKILPTLLWNLRMGCGRAG